MTMVPDPSPMVSYPCDVVLAVDTTFADGTAEVALRGELDFALVPTLFEQLAGVLSKKPNTLIFDMQGVTFIDCGVTAALARTARLLPGGTKPVIRDPSRAVRRLLGASRLDTFFQLDELPQSDSAAGQGAGAADPASSEPAADMIGTDGPTSDDAQS